MVHASPMHLAMGYGKVPEEFFEIHCSDEKHFSIAELSRITCTVEAVLKTPLHRRETYLLFVEIGMTTVLVRHRLFSIGYPFVEESYEGPPSFHKEVLSLDAECRFV